MTGEGAAEGGLGFITFRKAVASDAEGVAAVYLSSRKEFLPYAPLANSDDEVREWIASVQIPGGRVRVAEDREEIVGMMILNEEGKIGWIDHLYLAPGSVGKGIGSEFIRMAVSELGEVIRLSTFQENMGARRFYERHGFRAIASGDGSGNEENCPDVLYQLGNPGE